MRDKSIIITSVLILLLSTTLGVFFNDCIGNDAAAYYIPMIEAFGEGQYDIAFNPLIPPLVPTLAGVLAWSLPISGFTSLKLVSAVFVLLGLVPVYRLGRRLMSAEQAQWACLLYAVCAQVVRFGITAQLTAAKIFFVLWLLDGCVSLYENRRMKNVMYMGFAFAGLALCRTEGVLYAPLCLFALVIPSIVQKERRSTELFLLIRNAGLTALICLSVWSPWIAYEYKSTGYAILDSRQIMLVEKINSLTSPASNSETQKEISSEVEAGKVVYAQSFGEKFVETLDGFYMPYILLTCMGFVRRYQTKKLSYYELWILGAVVLHVTMMWAASSLGGGPVLKRYMFPAALFLMPHSALGWTVLQAALTKKIRLSAVRSVMSIILIVVVSVSVGDGLKQVIDSFRGKYRVEKEMGLWIREYAEDLDRNITPETATMGMFKGQWRGRSLIIAAAFPQTACWAGAQHIKVERRKQQSMQELMEFCQSFGVDVLKVDKAIRKSTVDFNPNHPMLQIVECPWKGTETELYLCRFE
ncbi:MAG: glycosyltransferase family 39 protein [Phycisphaerae bacterium]|nr:glycosyltransferase family 39 protein [Phycisphaerae bacterium]